MTLKLREGTADAIGRFMGGRRGGGGNGWRRHRRGGQRRSGGQIGVGAVADGGDGVVGELFEQGAGVGIVADGYQDGDGVGANGRIAVGGADWPGRGCGRAERRGGRLGGMDFRAISVPCMASVRMAVTWSPGWRAQEGQEGSFGNGVAVVVHGQEVGEGHGLAEVDRGRPGRRRRPGHGGVAGDLVEEVVALGDVHLAEDGDDGCAHDGLVVGGESGEPFGGLIAGDLGGEAGEGVGHDIGITQEGVEGGEVFAGGGTVITENADAGGVLTGANCGDDQIMAGLACGNWLILEAARERAAA